MTDELLEQTLDACPVIAIIRTRDAGNVPAVLRTLVDRGIHAVELTLTTPGALEAIRAAAASGLDGLVLGAGTVLDAPSARAAVEAGARYLVTPAVLPEVIDEARLLGVPVLPGALTPTEILQARSAGATMVKVFPVAAVGGPDYITAVRAPLPDVLLVPTGGVSVHDAPEYLRAGAYAVAMGSPLIGDACESGDMTGLASRADELLRGLRGWKRGVRNA
ncbi:bifunctional 4-hydroxy-2-oxoglutarate aldolase/2-dehydro-3-deoxy-phosphogluconate aldolase [Streptosporangium sp. NPDC023825]|uniref:bifunctional 4-hydroxy-2-oxoglutarate aldolase/2-dehydro-3-deoxy-phosphogluconate aldolase n=1 Tax=Streptosporangium sp. NPDC023825 TaxID=3154909 RepID=UPI0034376966